MVTRKRAINPMVVEPAPAEEDDLTGLPTESFLIRPDGYYWQAPDGKQEFGPFETLELAQADRDSGDDESEPTVGESLREAENEIGIADWIDPETGEPAQGQSPPHLEEE